MVEQIRTRHIRTNARERIIEIMELVFEKPEKYTDEDLIKMYGEPSFLLFHNYCSASKMEDSYAYTTRAGGTAYDNPSSQVWKLSGQGVRHLMHLIDSIEQEKKTVAQERLSRSLSVVAVATFAFGAMEAFYTITANIDNPGLKVGAALGVLAIISFVIGAWVASSFPVRLKRRLI